MADFRRFCSECFLTMPPDWNKKYCPSCGGRIKLRIVKKRSPSQGRLKPEAVAEREKQAEKVRPSRKLSWRRERIFALRESSALGPRFRRAWAVPLFLLNALTLGGRSVFWMSANMPSLVMMAKPEEKNIKNIVRFWLLSWLFAIALLSICAFDFITAADRPAALMESALLRGAVCAYCVSFLTGRHVMLWSREVIVDELSGAGDEALKSRAATFAPSSLLIWFIGAPYLQAHINAMIKKGGLATYSSSDRRRRRKRYHQVEAGRGERPGTEGG
ncbi:MAG: hypothetical protein LBQ36_03695 [Synergistaceae bacterium]|jgi:hypothetical protein|nr:hypothetical protein [Synergistaceae bacterium]